MAPSHASVLAEPDLESGWTPPPFPDFAPGLILGCRTAAGQLRVVHLAPTPREDEEEEETTPPVCGSLEELDRGWMLEHYHQVTRLLPGGIHVIGVSGWIGFGFEPAHWF